MKRVLYGLLAVAFAAIPAARVSGAPLPALASGPKTISGDTPPAVSRGLASLHGHHNGEDLLRINVGLAVHNSAQLDALIASVRIPGSPNFRHYVSTAQYMAQYAPTDVEAQAAKNWLQSQRLTVTGISADHLLVHVQAKAKDVERAFGVTINDYTYHGRSFHANDRDPTVPADLNVNWISGLDDFTVYQPDVTCVNPGPPARGCGYDGSDFRGGYNVSGDGKGQTIGFTLWGKELPQSDFTGYATGTSTTALTIGQAGNDGIDYVQVDGASTIVQTTVHGGDRARHGKRACTCPRYS